MILSKVMVLSTVLGLFSAGVAGAASVTFDLRGEDSKDFGRLSSAFSLTEEGLTATFDGKAFENMTGDGTKITGGTVQDGHIGRYYGGVGVLSAVDDESHRVDGSGRDDFVQITFDRVVTISKITFGAYNKHDYFRILTDASGDGAIGVGDAYGPEVKIKGNTPFVELNGLSTDIFAIGAFRERDKWTLRSVTVKFSPRTRALVQPSPVPLPAAAPLLLGGFALLAGLRRRKTA